VVSEVDKVYKAARKAQAEVLLKPTDEFYGDRVRMFLVDEVKRLVSRP
jgi:uncharacterized glyoxalase superfamily protein PhnB